MAGTQCSAINKHNLTLGHMRIITDLKKYNTIQNTDKSHGREQSLKVPWEGQIGREKRERRKRGGGGAANRTKEHLHDRLYIKRGNSPRHCREVVESYNRQKISEKGSGVG